MCLNSIYKECMENAQFPIIYLLFLCTCNITAFYSCIFPLVLVIILAVLCPRVTFSGTII